MAISAQMVKALRDKTGAGMMDCKKALTESGGDEEQAVAWLREKGLSKAQKRAGRAASEGLLVFAEGDGGKTATLTEVKCETDFVAKSDKFQDFVQKPAKQAVELAPETETPAPYPQELMDKPYTGDESLTVQDHLNELIAVLGENIKLGRYVKISLSSDGLFGHYVHATGKIGVIVEVACSAEAAANDKVKEFAKDMAMQVAAANPAALLPADLPQEMIEKEKDIYRQQTLAEGKPENIVDKIVEGRIGKYYKEVCLVEQPFIKDDKVSVKDLMKAVSKEVGDEVKLVRFIRLALGEDNQEAESDSE